MRLFLLLFGVTSGMWIDVPFVRQEKNGCGSAVVWMVMKYWSQGDPAPVQDIHRQLYSPEAGGVYASVMEEYLQQNGFQTFSFTANWEDLEQHLSRNRPLIVCLERNASGAPLHYVVLAGMDTARGIVWVNDPARRKLFPMDRREFERTWMDHWVLLAFPGRPVESPIPPRGAPVNSVDVQPDTNETSEMQAATDAFRASKYADARRHVASILHSNPANALANEFMATLFLLDDNTTAALKYWNRVGKPFIRDIRFEPDVPADPVLIERGFTFSRAAPLSLADYEATQERLRSTGVFTRQRLELDPVEGDQFDIVLRSAPRGFHPLSALRGLPYQTVYPEFFNIGGRSMNVRSLLRWDEDRQRAWVQWAAPIGRDPKFRYFVEVDHRDELWDTSSEAVPLRKDEIKAGVQSTVNGQWAWTSGVAFSTQNGRLLKYAGTIEHALYELPERRLDFKTHLSVETGRTFESDPRRFVKAGLGLTTRWFPPAKGNGLQATSVLRAGRIFGDTVWNELFTIGLDRDSELLHRTHRASREESYLISNWDVEKHIYGRGFVDVFAGPFLDAGVVSHRSGPLLGGGVQLRVSILGMIGANVSIGRDLRSGGTFGFVNATR